MRSFGHTVKGNKNAGVPLSDYFVTETSWLAPCKACLCRTADDVDVAQNRKWTINKFFVGSLCGNQFTFTVNLLHSSNVSKVELLDVAGELTTWKRTTRNKDTKLVCLCECVFYWFYSVKILVVYILFCPNPEKVYYVTVHSVAVS